MVDLSRLIRSSVAICKFVLATLLALAILTPLVICLALLRRFGQAPILLGKLLKIHELIRKGVYFVVDAESIWDFREDIMIIWLSEVELVDGLDPWCLRREINICRENARQELERGELAYTILGGFLSLVLGAIAGVQFLAIGLSITGLALTIYVSTQIIVIEIMSFETVGSENDTVEQLAFKKGWNDKVMRSSSKILIGGLSLILSRSRTGYQLGLSVIRWYSETVNGYESKWQKESTPD